MALEKKWEKFSQLLTSDSSPRGFVTVADSSGYVVSQDVTLRATGLPDKQLQVKRVYPGIVFLGGKESGPDQYEDLSGYTVSAGAELIAPEQQKKTVKPDDIAQATYQRGPANALRTLDVDEFGRPYSEDNPLPVVTPSDPVKKPWDEIDIDYNAVQDMEKVTYSQDDVPVSVADMTYDAYANLTNVKWTKQ